jgi:acetyltransferase-like isoleucine patch superfamily enzyme
MMTKKLRKLSSMRLPAVVNLVSRGILHMKAILYYRYIFGSFGHGSVLEKPVLLTNPHWMHIGNGVLIRSGVRLEAIAIDSSYEPELRIGDNVNIENFVQMSVIGRLIIGSNVTIASRTMILCGSHPFRDVDNPVKIGDRVSGRNSVIEIGDGSLIGAGVAILQNVHIGKHCVVAANSLINADVPDYSVALGNPASIILHYDHEKKSWLPGNRQST